MLIEGILAVVVCVGVTVSVVRLAIYLIRGP